LKSLFLSIITILVGETVQAQKTAKADIWSGEYAVYPTNDLTKSAGSMTILKLKDLKANDLPVKLQADLERWNLMSEQENKKDSTTVRRFLFNEVDDEYREFGWTDLHKTDKMNCIDGGHFFICQTDPETTVNLRGDKPFVTKTGVFGIWLHYGLVTLKKVK
jgi:hypothetical protein